MEVPPAPTCTSSGSYSTGTSRWFKVRRQMPKPSVSLRVALALTAVTLFTASASGQSPASPPANADKETVAAEGSRLDNKENKVAAETPRPNDIESQVADVKAENAALRESLRKMEEQQKALLEMVGRLQHRVDGATTAEVQPAVQPQEQLRAAEAPVPVTNA